MSKMIEVLLLFYRPAILGMQVKIKKDFDGKTKMPPG